MRAWWRPGCAASSPYEPGEQARPPAARAEDGRRLDLPYAVGDGRTHEFRVCAAPMTSSLLEPDAPLLQHFENLAEQ